MGPVFERVLTAPIAAVGLLAGFGVAIASGSRPLGVWVLAGCGLTCIVVWLRRDGGRTAAVLTLVGLVAFAVSHVLGHVIGAWPSVIVVSAALRGRVLAAFGCAGCSPCAGPAAAQPKSEFVRSLAQAGAPVTGDFDRPEGTSFFACRRSVFTQSPLRVAISDGATTSHAIPILVNSGQSANPPAPASEQTDIPSGPPCLR